MPEYKPRPYHNSLDPEENYLSLKRHIEDKDFKWWIPARAFQTSTAAAETKYAGGPAWSLANAATNEVASSIYVPVYWNVGKISTKLYYTGSASSTNPFNVTFTLSAFNENGTALTTLAGDATSGETVNIAGPAVASELVSYTVTEANWFAKTTAHDLFCVTVQRNGAAGGDTNTGSMAVMGVLLQFYPTRR